MDFERILMRPNKYLTNQLIAQAKDWDSFLGLRQLTTLREWERQKLADFVSRVELFTQTVHLGGITATDFMRTLRKEFALAEFYQEQSRIADDLDTASDEGLLEVMIALAGNYKTPQSYFEFLSKSIGDQESDADKNAREAGPDP